MVGSPPLLALAFCAACIFGQLVDVAQSQSQNKTQPRTDPVEVRALNSVFQKWGISAQLDQWNISGEPCSGAAIDSTAFDYQNYNCFIKCDCSFNNNSTCHITQLIVYGLDVFGVIPEELWTLTSLFRLNLAHNYLTGSLSASIGNLTRMQYLYLGFNALSGTLPKELGNLTDLKELRLLGNSFQGPIPSSFSNLTSLEELRLTGLSNGSSSLAFIKDMKSLSVLVLRNNSISDSIPSDIGEYQYLTLLDLSFNNIRGQIPDKLFKLSSLTHLFLGNNELSGNLPAQKSSSLLNIDLSYNYLSGSFPSWVNDQGLQLNLVANNYTLESFESSALPFGLNCLQRSFRCNQSDSGIYSEFAIRCGGPQLTYNQTVYERDTETLGPATYYVTYAKTWAVSNVGYYEGKSNQLSNFRNLPELFQTARQSALSLRYYGLGLQNGNYTVTLYFVETAFPDNITRQSRNRGILFYRILTYERKPEDLSDPLRRIFLRFQYQKTILKYISFGL